MNGVSPRALEWHSFFRHILGLEAALNGSRITFGLLFITPNWCWNSAETVENYSYFNATMGSTRMARRAGT